MTDPSVTNDPVGDAVWEDGDKVEVLITNTYPGRSNQTTEHIDPPGDEDGIDDWWEDEVFPLTGDGLGADEHAMYEAEVVAGPAWLVGKTQEWMG